MAENRSGRGQRGPQAQAAKHPGSDRRVKFMATSALMTAVLCVLGPLSIPIGPVPISLTNLAIYLMLYIKSISPLTNFILLNIINLNIKSFASNMFT